MTSDETTEETAVDQTDTEQAPVLSGVRVPNVRPGAISGLDHVLLDPDRAASSEASAPEREDAPSVDDELERIRGIEDDEERRDAADALWKRETRDDPGADHSELAEAIRVSVYGEDQSAEEIAGQVEESETAGTGDAENADTGEVTPGGESLPPVEQEDGDPLEPADDDPEGDKNDSQDDDPETSA